MSNISVDLTGKTAIVTGAGKGIGREIAICLANSGAKVYAISRTLEDLNRLKEEIRSRNGLCEIEAADIRNVSEITNVVAKIAASEARIDILINCAGVNKPVHCLEVSEESWDAVMDINLKGTFFMSQAVAKQMIQQRRGKIVSLTSQMAFVGYYKRAAYCGSKGGITQALKAMAVELAEYNININCIAPTFINTPLTKPMFEDAAYLEEVKSRSPMGKIGEPGDVAGAVLYLLSDSADLVTGSTILIDGGWTAW